MFCSADASVTASGTRTKIATTERTLITCYMLGIVGQTGLLQDGAGVLRIQNWVIKEPGPVNWAVYKTREERSSDRAFMPSSGLYRHHQRRSYRVKPVKSSGINCTARTVSSD